jgi:hypothetical protein
MVSPADKPCGLDYAVIRERTIESLSCARSAHCINVFALTRHCGSCESAVQRVKRVILFW